jgi:hypothetical protein
MAFERSVTRRPSYSARCKPNNLNLSGSNNKIRICQARMLARVGGAGIDVGLGYRAMRAWASFDNHATTWYSGSTTSAMS